MGSSNFPSSLASLTLMLPEAVFCPTHQPSQKGTMTILGKAENALWSEFLFCSISSFTEAMSQACRRRSSFHSTLSKPRDVIVHSSLLGPEITSPAWQRHRGAGTLAEAPCVASDGLFFSGVTATLKKQLRYKCIPFCSLIFIFLIDKLYFLEHF